MKKKIWLQLLKVLLVLYVLGGCAVLLYVSAYVRQSTRYETVMLLRATRMRNDTISPVCRYCVRGRKCWVENMSTGEKTLTAIDGIYSWGNDTLCAFRKDGRMGFFNRYTGREVIAPRYRRAEPFAEGLAAVGDDSGRIGFIDRTGKVVIGFRFLNPLVNHPDTYRFQAGYCCVADSTGRYGLVDRQGDWAVAAEYDHIECSKYGKRRVRKNGKYGVLDSASLRMLLPPFYDEVRLMPDHAVVRLDYVTQQAMDYAGNLVPGHFVYDRIDTLRLARDRQIYGIGKGVGLSDGNGRQVTPPMYEQVEELGDNLFACALPGGDVWVLTDKNGKEIN